MKLELKAKHFEGSDFYSDYCPIGNAYFELTGISPTMGLDWLTENKDYEFEEYYNDSFLIDRDLAQSHNWDETVIRTIELTEV